MPTCRPNLERIGSQWIVIEIAGQASNNAANGKPEIRRGIPTVPFDADVGFNGRQAAV
jgi:hypothetical protein